MGIAAQCLQGRVAELKVENNHLPMETHIFEGAGEIRRAVYLPGGTDTCTLRGEDCRYCGAFIEAPCPALSGLKRDSKCKEVIPFHCSSLANPVRLRRTTRLALAVAFSKPISRGNTRDKSHNL